MSRKSKTSAGPKEVAPRDLLSYPALKNDQNGRVFYTLTVPIDDLYPCCFLLRREDNRKEGYQRPLDEKRAREIAEYLDAGQSIASSVVLSAQPEAALEYSRGSKSIRFAGDTRAFAQLDGQHRLEGYQLAKTRLRVPVAIYQGLSRAEEAKLFIDINTKQRGVPQALLLDIRALAERESAHQAVLHKLFDALALDKKSPEGLRDLFSPSSSERWKVSRVTFNRAMGPALKGSVFSGLHPEDAAGVLRNYLTAIHAELCENPVAAKYSGGTVTFVRPAFFESALAVMDEVLREALLARESVKVEDLRDFVRPIANGDYSPAAFGGARPTKASVTAAMQALLRKPVVVAKEAM